MFWIVENFNQLKSFYNTGYKEAYIEVIPYSYKIHPAETQVSLVYIRPLLATKGYMFAIDHSEAMRLESELIAELIMNYDALWVWGKKEFLHFFVHKNITDLSLLSPSYLREETKAHQFLQQKYRNKLDINRIIPIVKHYEICEKNYDNLKQYINEPVNPFYNNKVPLVFNAIEKNGIQVDSQLFEDYFDKSGKSRVYTQYNYRTTTTRPSNRFGGINYAALNKENGCRKAFIPRNDKFVEIDISAYHPTLASTLINYVFDTEDIHGEFAKMYKVDYKKSKELTFKQLYGGVFKQYKHLEFFQKVEKYVKELWKKYEEQGYIACPFSYYKFEKDKLENMNPQKLFNYLLQNLETAINVRILWEIIKLLRKRKTKLVLYTYDSFLFDLDNKEEELVEEVLKIFKKYKLQVKLNYGSNYNFE